jgi:hypothetical protein
MFLKLSGQIEGQLREAYAKKQAAGVLNQSILADRLEVNRSVINRRLNGNVNMTEESIADMVWAMDYDITVNIFDPLESKGNQRPTLAHVAVPPIASPQVSNAMSRQPVNPSAPTLDPAAGIRGFVTAN